MKFSEGVAILKLLNTRHEEAMTIVQIIDKWNSVHDKPLNLRTAQRYLSEMSSERTSLVEVDDSTKERRYHLRLSEMAHWFMTEEAALYQALSIQVLQSTFGDAATTAFENQRDVAEHLSQEQLRTRRLRQRVRIVPDGIGRLRAKVTPSVLGSIMDALAGDQSVEIEYRDIKGKVSTRELAPLGLVAKDGSLYLLAVKGLSDRPHAFALHRIRQAVVRPFPAQGRPDFNLDEYIRETHQLSHVVEDQPEHMMVKLRVDPRWLYHFEERPLSDKQVIQPLPGKGQWALVMAPIPQTVILPTFILSYGEGVEVLEPESLRAKVSQSLRRASELYSDTKIEPGKPLNE